MAVIKRTHCTELLRIIELNCPDQIEFVRKDFTSKGIEAVIKDKFDGQLYELEIKPRKEG